MNHDHDRESGARWLQLVEIHEELAGPNVVMPMLASRIDGRPLQHSTRAVRFAEALAFSDAWSGISQAKRRRAA